MSQNTSSPVKDRLDPARAEACAVVLGRPAPGPTLPPFWHHLYFWEVRPPEELGRDGHIARGTGHIPDLGLPRRMWAGGELDWHAPVQTGHPAEKHTRLGPVQHKTGRSGPLALVSLHHDIHQDGILCLTERQDLVYRADPQPDDEAPRPPDAPMAPIERSQRFAPITLLRFSALTMNGHRIHWDEAYAREVEGHGGLVVHGPLLAEGLIALASERLGPLSNFRYRATSPTLAGEVVTFCLDGQSLWVRGEDGRQCMTGTALPAT